MRKRQMWTTVAAVALSTAALGVLVSPLIVEASSVTLRKSPSSIAVSAGKVFRGTSLDVLEDKGTYARVRGGGAEGWVRVTDLEPRRFAVPSGQGGPLAGETAAGRAQESASGKGLNDGVNDIAINYSEKSGVPTAALESLLQQRDDLVDKGLVEAFAKEGNVGKR